jgi:hypothetical protein
MSIDFTAVDAAGFDAFAVEATFVPPQGGAAVPLTAIVSGGEQVDMSLGGTGFQDATHVADLLLADVPDDPKPQRSPDGPLRARLTVTGGEFPGDYEIHATQRSRSGGTWRCGLKPAGS